MATLDAFGFANGKRNKAIINKQHVPPEQKSQICAVIPPSANNDIIKKKLIETAKPTTELVKKKSKKKTSQKVKTNHSITKFFSPIADIEMKEIEQDDEEPVIICKIRRKLSFVEDFWNVIQSEYALDEMIDDELEETTLIVTNKRKREDESHTQLVPFKKLTTIKKKSTDIELSYIMKNFLNIQERCKYNNNNNNNTMNQLEQNITSMEQDEEKDDNEDLTRALRNKWSISQSEMFILQITNELLYSL